MPVLRTALRVDLFRQRFYVPLLAALLACSACAPATSSSGAAVDETIAARLGNTDEPTRRLHVTFEWNVKDRDLNFSGRGVLRLDRATRARVDLFDPRGNSLAAAILEGEQMRVFPSGIADRMLPPANLLWSALGVFRAPVDVPLVATAVNGGTTTLEYARDDTRWRFRFESDTLRHVEWTAPGGRRTVELRGTSRFGLPQEGSFRDWTEFRELTLRATQVEETTGFEPDVWILPGGR